MIETIIGTLVGLVIGGYITYRVSGHYYQRASEDLRQEAGKQRALVNALASHLQRSGVIQAEWGEDGNLTNFVPLEGVAESQAGMRGNLADESPDRDEEGQPRGEDQ